MCFNREYDEWFEPQQACSFKRLKQGRYELWEKIFESEESVVWIAKDLRYKKFVAIKIPLWSDVDLNFDMRHEIRCLLRIRGSDEEDNFNCIRILDQFQLRSINRSYQVLVMELLGISLAELLLQRPPNICVKKGGMKQTLVRASVSRILTALSYLHNELDIIHMDVRPDNISLKHPWCKVGWKPTEEDFNVKLIDFTNFSEPGIFQEDYVPQRPNYRSPEAILGYPDGPEMDMWSLGCTAYEILTGESLFDVLDYKQIVANLDHLHQMQQLLGPCPKKLIFGGEHSRLYFAPSGELYGGVDSKKGMSRLIKKLITQKHAHLFDDEGQMLGFYDFLCGCLQYDPAKRLTAQEALLHPWITKNIQRNYRYVHFLEHKCKESLGFNLSSTFVGFLGCLAQWKKPGKHVRLTHVKRRRSSSSSSKSFRSTISSFSF